MSEFYFHISGNVTVHPEAAIASDVLLQADPGSHLVIAAGACIGAGSVLHAHQGTLEVECGATLGTGVLIIGKGRIGARACIGSMTTIFDQSVEAEQVIPPNSLLGEPDQPGSDHDSTQRVESGQTADDPKTKNEAAAAPSDNIDAEPAADTTGIEKHQPHVVYGQASLHRMLIALFPHRQPLDNDASSPNSSASGDTRS